MAGMEARGNRGSISAVDDGGHLRRLRHRLDRVGLELPKIEVRCENLSVETDMHMGSRAVPNLWNAAQDALEDIFSFVRFFQSKKRINKILTDVNVILKPSRMTLLLGTPGSGKTSLLLALAGKLDKKLSVSGKVSYCGHDLSEFVPQRICSYVSQHDLHNSEMTVREILEFSGQCLGVGTRYEIFLELLRRESDDGISPDLEVYEFLKGTTVERQNSNLMTDYILKVLGLEICSDIIVGDVTRRGISGGQKKRLSTGEMLAGPAKVLFMDEISTGLDSSTTYKIVKFIGQMVHAMDITVIISLLQPAPEIFELFDEVILLCDGQIIYQGPREHILEFFESMGFRCPDRKGVADFLQEVTSRKDQQQYWCENRQYRYISVTEFAQSFKSFYVGKKLLEDIAIPYDKTAAYSNTLPKEKYGISSWKLLRLCFSREWLLMKRNSFLHILKITQLIIISIITMTVFIRTQMSHKTITDGGKYLGALVFGLLMVMFNGSAEIVMTVRRLPVFYKQRDSLFYPPWAFGIPYILLKIPSSLLESGLWILLTYYVIGFAPSTSRIFRQFLAFFLTHQMALALFRLIAAVGRTMLMANSFGMLSLLFVFIFGGFTISKDNIQSWWIWGYWISPMMYGQNAVAINEYLDPIWNSPNNTVGVALLKSRGMPVNGDWYWISVGALIGFCLLYNAFFFLSLTCLNAPGTSHALKVHEDAENNKGMPNTEIACKGKWPIASCLSLMNNCAVSKRRNSQNYSSEIVPPWRGMILPFQPLSLAFNHVNYYVDTPPEMKSQGIKGNRIQLLCDVCAAFRPGFLVALVGVSGAGKTTLMDLLAGRKMGGYIEGSINVSGYPKKQETFARISAYCEQNDIHSPYITVYESIVYSASLRLAPEIAPETHKMFIEEVLELVELNPLKDAIVGQPGINGLSIEQRKRLTIAVELVSNPSIIFMDEPTSGLDARAAAIVMRVIRNTVNTGRTVLCTIHQPSVDIFETFDELLLMKTGGKVIYVGELGHHSHKLVEYFEAVPGVPKITEGYNPATWMLEISSPSVEGQLNVDFADIYSCSPLFEKNQELIRESCVPPNGSKDLSFTTKYARTFLTQCRICLWKQDQSYWRNPQYNAMRFFVTIMGGLLFGSIFWKKANKIGTQQDLLNLLGTVFIILYFPGFMNVTAVQPVAVIERIVFYRERSAGMYSSMSYAFAQVTIEVVYITVQSLCYGVPIFIMIGFNWQINKFLWFIYFVFMCLIYFTLYGMLLVAITPNHETAAILLSFVIRLWNLFSGFLITRPLTPIWWRWFFWTNPLAWTIYGVMTSQLGDLHSTVEVPGQSSMPIQDALKEYFGFEHGFLSYVGFVHLGFVIYFFLIYVFCIKHVNYQKR